MSDCPELRTERLLLRRWRESDRAPFAEMNADAAVMEFIGAPMSRARSDAHFDSLVARFAEQGFGFWALEAPGVAPLVGFAGLNVPRFGAPFMPAVEVGWRLARPYWGRGYATEAGRAALEFAFGVLGIDEVVAFTSQLNVRSQRVMERLGMTRDLEGDFEHPLVEAGSPLRPHVLYRIRPEDLR